MCLIVYSLLVVCLFEWFCIMYVYIYICMNADELKDSACLCHFLRGLRIIRILIYVLQWGTPGRPRGCSGAYWGLTGAAVEPVGLKDSNREAPPKR